MLSITGYKTSELLYESTNSLVYRGIKRQENQSVILKVLKQDYPTPAELTRYRQEYKVTHDLDLSGVVKAYGIEKYQNTLAIILEDFGAKSLSQTFEQQEIIAIADFLPLAIQISEALGHIHVANIIHKDINPANIVWNQEVNKLKIIDFSIASRLPRENPTLMNPEQLEGTLPYISPEQTGRMNRAVDYRTDLYSLGVTFYELLTGQLPFESDSAMELVHCHIAKIPVPIYEINPAVPPILSDIVMKLMAKNVEQRYQSAFGVKFDLEKIQTSLKRGQDLSRLKFELAQHDFSGKLYIPQKLYGREHELNTLLEAFKRVSSGRTEMMLVAGYSGVGKTALVNEVHKPMTEKHGYFACGKFDQFQKNVPCSAITQAFNGLCHYLLKETEASLAVWQSKILAALGNNAQIIIDVIPDLELVIGQQPAVAEVGATETQNRFQMYFRRFVKALCDRNHPFILFIDDLQWFDSASLSLLKSIVLDDEIKYLLIIGAYRDNEVDPTHPLMMEISALQKANIIINTITLSNLLSKDVNHLLQDSLWCEAKQTQPLTDLMYQKTEGNAFFTHQFLHTLYAETLLNFDFKTHQWSWDIERIAGQNITDNVVDLMANKIDKLPEQTSKILQLAACIGNTFDLSTLAIIYQHSPKITLETLMTALTQGLILPLDEHYKHPEMADKSNFKFLHDRVQQAAYALIDDVQKKAVHVKIGHLLLANVSQQEKAENLFNIANQFNKGLDLITQPEDKLVLAELNCQASQKARKSMASQPALDYAKQAMFLLPENPWQNQYQLTLKIYKERAEAEFVNAHYEEAETFIKEVIKQAQDVSDKVDMYYLLITMHGVKGDFNQAVETGKAALALFGIILPSDAEKEHVSLQEMDKAYNSLRDVEPASILNWQDLTDETSIMIIKLMVVLEPPVYIMGDSPTYIYLVSRTVNISVQHKGLIAELSKMYMNYAFLIGDIYGDYVSSYAFGTMALKIADRYHSGVYTCKTSLVFGNWVNPWCRPFNQAARIHTRGYQAGIESGEYEFAGYNVYGYINNLFAQGQDLIQIETEIVLYLPLVEKINHQLAAYFLLGTSYVIDFLKGKDMTLPVFGQEMPIEQMLATAEANNMSMLLCSYYANMGFAHYLLGDVEQAALQMENAQRHLNGVFGSTAYSECLFRQALVITAQLPKLDDQEKSAYQAKLNDSLDKLSTWAEKCCTDNFEHKFLLIKAETLRIHKGNDLEIMQLYEQAILSARDSGFIQNQALCNELAANFYLERHLETSAKAYMKQAHACYQQWGATAKVQDLEQRYPQWLEREVTSVIPTIFATIPQATLRDSANPNSTTTSSQWLDLETVIKASQTLSGEIQLSHLLSKMMQIVIENAGAQRGFLILPMDNQWVIEAEGSIDSAEVTVLHSLPVDAHLPEVIISYVARTQENVVLNDARSEGQYTDNPYIQTHQTQSVLCFPIVYQQQLRAILYFENNLATGVFTENRLKMLKILSSQIAISLENARFVEQLEASRRQAEVANETKTAFLANVSHELRTPLNAILGYTQLFHRETELPKLVRDGSELIEQSSKYLLTLINDIIDISTVERGEISIFPTDMRFDNFLNNLVGIFLHRAKEKGLAFHYTFSDSLPIGIVTDEKRLRQILTHLLGNAVKFTETGSITFSVTRDQNHIQFSVKDTGVGIASDNLETIFLPFEQISDWRHKSEGTGLGLSLVKKLVDTLDGTLHVSSELNQGSCFQVNLPFVESYEHLMGEVESIPQHVESSESTEQIAEDELQNAIQLLSPEQFASLYDASMTGDINMLVEHAGELDKASPKFMPLVKAINQAAENFDTDTIADLLTPINN